MAQTIASFDTAHSGTIHDAQLDYYGKRLATASADHSIRIWDVSGDSQTYLAELKGQAGHEGPVWQVAWAHPKFGNILASCSYDKKIIIWKEVKPSDWQVAFKDDQHTASVNSVSMAPWEYGLQVAAASSDGTVSILTYGQNSSWSRKSFKAHGNGVNAVSWAPATSPATLASGPAVQGAALAPQRLVSGGCDNQVKIWQFNEQANEWLEHMNLGANGAHTEWVRDVAWRPNVGIPSNTIASCSEDHTLIIWQQEMEGQQWAKKETLTLPGPVWRVSWSVTGSILSASCGDNTVVLYKEATDGKWESVTTLNEQGFANPMDTMGAMAPPQAPPAQDMLAA